MQKIILTLLFFFLANCLFAQDKIKVDKYEFVIGESTENFLSKYPEFQVDEYIDDQYPDDITQYYFNHTNKEVTVLVQFYKNNLFYVNINDLYWSGLLSDLDPINFGFTKTGEEIEPSPNQYSSDLITEFYEKGDVKLKFSGARFGFLVIEKPVNSASSDIDNDFINFYQNFKTALLEKDKEKITSYTNWSKSDGGFFSISVSSEKGFMNNVFKLIFTDFWENAFTNAELNKSFSSEYGMISLSKIEPISFGFNANDVVYSLDNCGNALIFKLENGEFKLVACFNTG